MTSKICIYHDNCMDGFGAAYAVWRKFPHAEFVAASYQQDPPDVKGKDVVIVDFSYKRDVLIKMATAAATILIIDHHKTAEADLVDLPSNVTTVFDMNKSGAVLAWEFFNRDEPVPVLLKHIQDRDLWKFELHHTRDIAAGLFSYDWSMVPFDAVCKSDMGTLELAAEGQAILRKHDKDVTAISKTAFRMIIDGYDIPVANCNPMFASDVGHVLSRGEPFAATYHDDKHGRKFSLRSEPNGLDVSSIAAKFGGGGHKHAAGFVLELGEVVELPL